MDAVRFLEERKRMFKNGKPIPNLDVDITYDSEMAVKFVESWSAAHPRKTRQSVFLEQFPNIELDRNGIINISPCRVDPKQYSSNGKNCCKFQACSDCRREFWSQEVE
jgi:hypothetical protein